MLAMHGKVRILTPPLCGLPRPRSARLPIGLLPPRNAFCRPIKSRALRWWCQNAPNGKRPCAIRPRTDAFSGQSFTSNRGSSYGCGAGLFSGGSAGFGAGLGSTGLGSRGPGSPGLGGRGCAGGNGHGGSGRGGSGSGRGGGSGRTGWTVSVCTVVASVVVVVGCATVGAGGGGPQPESMPVSAAIPIAADNRWQLIHSARLNRYAFRVVLALAFIS